MSMKIVIKGKEHEYLTASDLIEILQQVPDDTLVVMSKDAEGNSYSPWASYSIEHFEFYCSWSGDPRDPEEPDSSSEDGFWYDKEDRERFLTLPKAVILGPVN